MALRPKKSSIRLFAQDRNLKSPYNYEIMNGLLRIVPFELRGPSNQRIIHWPHVKEAERFLGVSRDTVQLPLHEASG